MKRLFCIGVVSIGFLLGGCSSKDFVSSSGLLSSNFQMVIDQKSTDLYRLHNSNGVEVCITNYGARIVSVMVPDRDGKLEDVVCGFDSIAHYTQIRQNFGSVVGRYIGRILGGRFTLDGVEYHLQTNGTPHCSHGGYPGFADKVWTVKCVDSSSLQLAYISHDGENGFPGKLDISVTYTLTHNNELSILYQATTTKPTVLNPSNHSFFNLSGNLYQSVESDIVWVDADSIAQYDENKCVTGCFIAVEDTPFDFRSARPIGERIDEDNSQLSVTKGYDHTWKINRKHDGLHRAATIVNTLSGRTMEIYTTEPGLHIYTANGHRGNIVGKQSISYPHRNSICFEAMHYADSPNKPHLPSTTLRPGEQFRSETVFKFGVARSN